MGLGPVVLRAKALEGKHRLETRRGRWIQEADVLVGGLGGASTERRTAGCCGRKQELVPADAPGRRHQALTAMAPQ